jgi:predicted RNA-binding protein associated with RNAse of E/G family
VVRHPDGRSYDTLDLMLDLVVLSTGEVMWKDTDHWAWAATSGVFTQKEVASVEAVREELVADAELGSGDFDGTWTNWSPSSSIPAPGLPTDWDRAITTP